MKKLLILIFFLIFSTLHLYSQNTKLNPIQESDEIDIEIKKYIQSIKDKRDYDEEKLREIFGPPLNLDSIEKDEEALSEQEGEYNFNNVSEEELEKKINEYYNQGHISEYIVMPKDTLYSIAKKFNMNLSELYQLNPELKNKSLYVNDKIKVINKQNSQKRNYQWEKKQIVSYEEKKYKVKKGESLFTIAKKFNISISEIKKLNNLKSDIIHPEQILLVQKEKIIKDYKVRKLFILPVEGYITSGYGYRRNPFITNLKHFHKGIDIAANMGTPIKAARDGLVIFSGRMEGFGNCIFIRHQDGFITVYGHNKLNYVKVGDIVMQGQMIGEVGRTGFATGPHLHFEVRKMDQPVDPVYALNLEEKIQLSIRKVALK